MRDYPYFPQSIIHFQCLRLCQAYWPSLARCLVEVHCFRNCGVLDFQWGFSFVNVYLEKIYIGHDNPDSYSCFPLRFVNFPKSLAGKRLFEQIHQVYQVCQVWALVLSKPVRHSGGVSALFENSLVCCFFDLTWQVRWLQPPAETSRPWETRRGDAGICRDQGLAREKLLRSFKFRYLYRSFIIL